jgi:hypothetical protein
VKFLTVAKPRPALNKKDAVTGQDVLEYSIRLEFSNKALGKLGDGAPTNLKELLRSIEGKTKMSRITNETADTFQVNFKTKKQPKVTIGSGDLTRELTAEEIKAELGNFDGRHDTAEASVSALLIPSDVAGRAPSVALSLVNILSSNITARQKFNTQEGIDELNALYDAS